MYIQQSLCFVLTVKISQILYLYPFIRISAVGTSVQILLSREFYTLILEQSKPLALISNVYRTING